MAGLSWLLSPLSWLLLGAVLALVAWRLRSPALVAGSAVVAVLAFAAATPLAANALLARIEGGIGDRPACIGERPGTVVALAGGVDRLPRDAADFEVMNAASRRRTERAVRYWSQDKSRRIVVVGGSVGEGGVSYADLMHAYARRLGVPAAALQAERESSNTRQNAAFLARLVPSVPRRIALSTSALHMPRATMEFEAAGYEVCPLPADYQAVPAGLPHSLVPTSRALLKTEAALHEAAGIVHHRLRSWRKVDRPRAER